MSFEDMGVLLDTFSSQPLDFYGALRAATYDGQIRAWIRDDVVGADLADEDANMAELSRRLINRCAAQFKRVHASSDEGSGSSSTQCTALSLSGRCGQLVASR